MSRNTRTSPRWCAALAAFGLSWVADGTAVALPLDLGGGWDHDRPYTADAERLTAIGTGEILITEFMYDPEQVQDAPSVGQFGDGEYIELYNPSGAGVNIQNWKVTRGDGRTFTIDTSLVVPANDYVILASQANLGVPSYGVTADFVWPRPVSNYFFLRQTNDTIRLEKADGTDVSVVVYDENASWPTGLGRSLQLQPTLNDEAYVEIPQGWCVSTTLMATGGDYGTPGVSNTSCSGIDVDSDGHFTAQEDCDDTDPTIHFDQVEVPEDGEDQDCDGVDLVSVLSDPNDDSGYSATNELTELYAGWSSTALVLAWDYTIESNAMIWHVDLDLGGGETDFHGSRGYAGAFPTDVVHTLDIDFMVAAYGAGDLFAYEVNNGGTIDISVEAESLFRTTYLSNGSPGFAFIRIPWDSLYNLGPTGVPVGAELSIVGMIRAGDNTSPYAADLAPDNAANPVTSYLTMRVDIDDDGVADPEALDDADLDGQAPAFGDCDDNDPASYTGHAEVCDGADNDCDGVTDEGFDVDGSGGADCVDDDLDGETEDEGDCDDTDGDVNTGATELCNEVDDDCDTVIDEPSAADAPLWYQDSDGDTYGNAAVSQRACDAPSGHVSNDDDCNDGNANINPGKAEITCNGVNEDCNPSTADAPDVDSDTYDICGSGDTVNPDGKATDCNDASNTVNPGRTETTCNGINDDCNASTGDAPDADSDTYDVCGSSDTANPDGKAADCNDASSTVNPGRTETTCNGVNDDCNASTGDAPDADSDTYDVCGSSDAANPDGKTKDCNDASNTINPGRAETICNGVDENCSGASDDAPDADGDTYDACAPADPGTDDSKTKDCNDASSSVNPGRTETTCNGIDDDCSSATLDAPDADSDTYDVCASTDAANPDGKAKDCNDASNTVNPGRTETTCNGIDDDCSASTGDAPDADSDTYDVCGPSNTVNPDGKASDCNDASSTVNPGRSETTCNGINDDCNASTADAPDADADTYDVCSSSDASNPDGKAKDCDDTRAIVNPGHAELCDTFDNNCNGTVDENTATDAPTWYLDADADTYGRTTGGVKQCYLPAPGYVTTTGDCNDLAPTVYPGATETCNGVDEDCDSKIDEPFDVDQDGAFSKALCATGTDCNDNDAAIKPGATERCDNVDGNCDGVTDATTFDVDNDGYLDATASCSPTTIGGKPATDCNDAKSAINPAASEICDSIDNDCDAKVDDADPSVTGRPLWYPDGDDDGYGDEDGSALARCVQPAGYEADHTDCDDANPAYNPGVDETDCTDPNDYNCDGSVGYSDEDNDGYPACEDCDDNNASISPVGTEVCDGVDNDCDDLIDDADASTTGEPSWYPDNDDDGARATVGAQVKCVAPEGTLPVSAQVDCDDNDDERSPLLSETCDGKDNNCNTTVDEGVKTTFYQDEDQDTYGNAAVTSAACAAPSGYVANDDDCDDDDAGLNPTTVWYLDVDDDGYGTAAFATLVQCAAPQGYSREQGDCADNDAAVNPTAALLCDGKDNNCDGLGDAFEGYDVDQDTYLDEARCAGLGEAGDCNDAVAAINPAAEDTGGNEVDEDCDGALYDVDGDGFGVDEGDCDDTAAGLNPDATDVGGNEVDEDCDGDAYDVDGDGFGALEGDCDDTNAGLNPEAEDVGGNTVDEDCDGTLYDEDGDGYGVAEGDCDDLDPDINPGEADAGGNEVDENCDGVLYDVDGDGYGVLEGDCDDTDASASPDGVEVPYNGVDEDCLDGDELDVDGDGHDAEAEGGDDCDDANAAINPDVEDTAGNDVDEDCSGAAFDVDGDGYGDADDCDDSNGAINPDAVEECGNVVDENCDGDTLLACDDEDADGFTVEQGDCDDALPGIFPDAPEVCADGIDNNCNGAADEGCDSTAGYLSACSVAGSAGSPAGLLGFLTLLVPGLVWRRAGARFRVPHEGTSPGVSR